MAASKQNCPLPPGKPLTIKSGNADAKIHAEVNRFNGMA
jgi:hypothetical protein